MVTTRKDANGKDNPVLNEAARLRRRDLMPVPVARRKKFPVIDDWEKLRLGPDELSAHFKDPVGNIGIILGEPSKGTVDVDLDCPESLELASLYLPPTTAKTGRPSRPASHWWYCAPGLATNQYRDPVTNEMLVELRSTGGQTLVGPSWHDEDNEQYEFLTADPEPVPGPMLAACVKALADEIIKRRYPNGVPQKNLPAKKTNTNVAVSATTQDPAFIEQRALAYLATMDSGISGCDGHGRTMHAARALCWGFCLEPDHAFQILLTNFNPRCCPPWSEKELRHKVDDASSKAFNKPRGWLRDDQGTPTYNASDYEDRSPQPTLEAPAIELHEKPLRGPDDPGPLPDELLFIPGFVGDLMDHTLRVAPYPNHVMAFAGAMAMLSTLTGRKVRDSSDCRTNFNYLALGHSGCGKDMPRKVNKRLAQLIGHTEILGERFSSGEGIEDAMRKSPVMMFQTDEIDGLIRSMGSSRPDPRFDGIQSSILTLYSSANSVMPVRRKAGDEAPGYIDQPHFVLFGTAIPNIYYESLSDRMLTNGFFSRTITFESLPRSEGQEPAPNDVPWDVTSVAKWWMDEFNPGQGNLDSFHPVPQIVNADADGRSAIEVARKQCDREYKAAERRDDAVGTTVWARAHEHIRKLSLLYACSENHLHPVITGAAATWALEFVLHQTRRMLFMAHSHSASNPFHAECQRIVRYLRDAQGNRMSHSFLMKRMKVDAQQFGKLIGTLNSQGDIDIVPVKTAGRTGVAYQLVQGR